MSDQDKVVITAALTGAMTRKAHNPGIPYKPEEWAQEVKRCEDAGASVIAVHFREYETGDPTVDEVVMRETMDAITSSCNCVVNLSTGVSLETSLEDRKKPIIHHRPEMASLNPGSTNFCMVNWNTGEILGDATYANPFKSSLEFAAIMKEKKIKPEMECFSPAHIENVKWFQEKHDFADTPLHFGFVFGVAGGMQFSELMLSTCTNLIPHDATWMLVGVGPNCHKVTLAAATFGGHIRVGLEDNIWLDLHDKALSQGTWDQVEKAVEISRYVGREPATVEETRRIFHLRGEND